MIHKNQNNRFMSKKQTRTVINWICTALIIIACFIFIYEAIISWQKILKGFEVNSKIKIEVIDRDTTETLYIKFRAWGLAGNHEEIVISPYSDSLTNPKTDYIIYGSTELYLDMSHKKVVLTIPQENISEPNNKYTFFEIKQDVDILNHSSEYKNKQLIQLNLSEEQNSIIIIKNE